MIDTKVTSELLSALCAAQTALRTLGKDRSNDQQRFRYVSAEKLIVSASEVLGRHGLVFVRLTSELGEWGEQVVTGRSGSSTYVVADVRNTFAVLHAGSCGALVMTYTVPAVQTAGRAADKAKFAADTEALGYALRDLLLVARGDEDDVAGRPDEEPEAPRAAEVPPDVAQVLALAAALPGSAAALDAYAVCKGEASMLDLLRGLYSTKRPALADLHRALSERIDRVGGQWMAALETMEAAHAKAAKTAREKLAAAGVSTTAPASSVGLTLYLLGL